MAARTVLHQADMARALTRIAHEILEANKGTDGLVVLGIPTRGVELAERVAALLTQIGGSRPATAVPTSAAASGSAHASTASTVGTAPAADQPWACPVGSLDVTMYRDDLARNPVRSTSPTRIPGDGIDGKTVVLVDDVLYSGRTIRAALDALADVGRPAAVRLAVLVDRGHRELPIRPDYVGKNLPSAASERVNVLLTGTDGVDAVTIEDGSGAAA